ncbi:hypothetical protein [Prevotella sp. KH2C16]|nr:hypothetical protein [Prevotella sp. KH2C16]
MISPISSDKIGDFVKQIAAERKTGLNLPGNGITQDKTAGFI